MDLPCVRYYKIPCILSNMETVLLKLVPGQLLYMDFGFMSEVSIREF